MGNAAYQRDVRRAEGDVCAGAEMLFCRLARPERFELPTPWFEAKCSIQLSYGRRLLLKHESQRCRESGEIVGQVWEMESDKK